MNRVVSLILLVVGIVLVISGVSALDSVGDSFSRLFTGSPTDKTIWLLIGGAALVAVGLTGVGRRSN